MLGIITIRQRPPCCYLLPSEFNRRFPVKASGHIKGRNFISNAESYEMIG